MDLKLQRHPLGFYEVVNKPTNVELQEYYAEKYYQESKGSYEQEYSDSELKTFQNRLVQRHAVLKSIQPRLNKIEETNFLDVGCGEGYALAYFKEQGYKVKGFDFSSAGVASKNPNCLNDLSTGNLFDLLQYEIDSTKQYDIVWLQNVLEHVIDPVGLMKSLRALVSDNGVAVITVPNDCSIVQNEALSSGHIDRPFWVHPPDHLSYFDNSSLVNIATNTGWVVTDLLADFPIDWYLYHSGSNYVMDSSAGDGANKARVQLENLFANKPIEDVLDFWRAMARIGSGRNLTIFLNPIEI